VAPILALSPTLQQLRGLVTEDPLASKRNNFIAGRIDRSCRFLLASGAADDLCCLAIDHRKSKDLPQYLTILKLSSVGLRFFRQVVVHLSLSNPNDRTAGNGTSLFWGKI
jgi:hypothetical protein